MDRSDLSKSKRVVVKVGTSSLTDSKSRLDSRKVGKLVSELMSLRSLGKEVVLVSSGAIGAAVGYLNLDCRPRDMPKLQALAAIGQNILMREYEKYFSKHKQTIAQVLLTREDFFNRKRYLNARNTFSTLLKLDTVPIVNENDTIAVEEIGFGDNDSLSALVASSIDADLLIVLSDVKGLYTRDPRRNKKTEFISQVTDITSDLEKLAGSGSSKGRGGMATKLQAARIMCNSGIPMVLVDGSEKDVLKRVVTGEEMGTIFLHKARCELTDRELWIMYASSVKGSIVVDEGARKALVERGSSLLPSGVKKVKGVFDSGDTVAIVDSRGSEFARAVVNYSSAEVEKLRGRQSNEIEKVLGRSGCQEIIYRSNMVLL